MTYAEIKRATLSHLNQYSIAGAPIASSYNNQADYLNRIPQFINEALVNIRTLVKPEPVVFALNANDGEEYGNLSRYELPSDFHSLKTGGVSVLHNGQVRKTNNYRLQGKKYILVPRERADHYTIEYHRYPNLLPAAPADDFELEEDLEVIQTAAYYAAAQLVLHDDETVYAYLYNDYESRLSRIGAGVSVEVQPVQDAYLFNVGWCNG